MTTYALYDNSIEDAEGFCAVYEISTKGEMPEAIDTSMYDTIATDNGWISFAGKIDTKCRWHPARGVFRTADGRIVREPIPVLPPVSVPSVTPMQFRTWLLVNKNIGRDMLTALIDDTGLKDVELEKTHIALEYASQIDRSHNLVNVIGDALKMSASDLDNAFRAAAKL